MAKQKENKETTAALSYFDKRMQLLGITPEINSVELWQQENGKQDAELKPVPIFREVELGIEIIVYSLDRLRVTFKTDTSRFKNGYSIIRLKEPVVKDGREMKYRIPKGGGTYPFFPPQLIEKFEKKIPMKTVFITEGYFKAFKAAMHGVDIIGLSSITHMKDKETGGLHDDILALVKSGLVEKFVWLTDGDCLDVTNKEITEDKDLYTRPYGFYSSITTFKTLLDDYSEIEKWFMHISTDTIIADDKKITRDQVKGLDDLLVTYPSKVDEIVQEMYRFSSGGGSFFQRFNVSSGTGKVWRYFHLGDVNDFFLFHSDRRPELKNKEFKFHGTTYLWNDQKNLCEIRMPGTAKLYFRVGDDYYKFIERPNQYGKVEKVFVERRKTTITDDHGKGFCTHVSKYEAFCNVPSHSNFQPVIHNCFNVYSPLDHTPEDDKCTMDDCPSIINLIQHIWGHKQVSFKDKNTGKKHDYANWELALDYLQLLYHDPSQKLPILCLVSRENNTGKSTLGFFLREFLGANTAIVGNADIVGDFNAHWVTKSMVVVDEAKIDKHQAIEKMKMLSTAKKVYMNAKGKGQVELDCFIKFILITNNEDNFITANEEDVRYWVIKVPQLKTDDPNIMDKIVNEIPAFMSFLNERKLLTEKRSRMWFHFDLLKTDALRRVISYSEPTIIKEIKQGLKDLFLDTGVDKIMMTAEVVMKELLGSKKYERNYLHMILKDKMKVLQYHVFTVDTREMEYNTEDEAIAAAQVLFPDDAGFMLQGRIKIKYKITRYQYPSFFDKMDGNSRERIRMEAKDNGRPYVFYRSNFVNAEDNVEVSAEDKFINSVTPEVLPPLANDDELPFPNPK